MFNAVMRPKNCDLLFLLQSTHIALFIHFLLSIQLFFTDEDELEIFSTILQKKAFSPEILLCVLSDILETPPQ